MSISSSESGEPPTSGPNMQSEFVLQTLDRKLFKTPRLSQVRLWSLTRGPHYELSSGKFLKCRDLAAAGSVARCPPVGESGSSRSPSPRCAPPAHSPRPPRAALRPTRRPLRGAVQSRQVQRRRLLPNRGHDRGGRNTAVRSAAAAPQTARPRSSLGLTGQAGGGAPGAPPPKGHVSRRSAPRLRSWRSKTPQATQGG